MRPHRDVRSVLFAVSRELQEFSVSIEQHLFRQVMSRFASGVTVVTTACNGQLAGLTVSSFASLSLNPTLVMIGIANYASSRSAIGEAGQFAVNILAEHQEDISRRFASPDTEKFLPNTYTLSARGLPLLQNVVATLECQVANAFPGGDHTIFVGEAMDAQVYPRLPLLYYRSGYYQFGAS
jgi:flavin reductase (DIM6/NTAB) family NADH-FMN oxidoreductase RutF